MGRGIIASGISEEDLEMLMPQFNIALTVLRTWPLGRPVTELAALLVLKIIAVTSQQICDAGLYRHTEKVPTYGPNDCGFF